MLRAFFLGSLLIFLPKSAARADDASRRALVVVLADGRAVQESEVIQMSERLREHASRELRIESVVISTRGAGERKLGTELAPALRAAVERLGEVDILLIGAHGLTKKEDGVDRTVLSNLGSFSASGLDPDLSAALAPLAGRLSRDATVLLNACKTFCGSQASAEARARSLLAYLGAVDGRVYGARTFESALTPPGSDAYLESRALRDMARAWVILGGAFLLAFVDAQFDMPVYGQLLAFFRESLNAGSRSYAPDFLAVVSYAVATLVPSITASGVISRAILRQVLPRLNLALSNLGWINEGYLIQLSGLAPVRTEVLRRSGSDATLFSEVDCGAKLTRSDE